MLIRRDVGDDERSMDIHVRDEQEMQNQNDNNGQEHALGQRHGAADERDVERADGVEGISGPTTGQSSQNEKADEPRAHVREHEKPHGQSVGFADR